jgi:RNA polymerase sigma-70 factor (sigma-E family)
VVQAVRVTRGGDSDDLGNCVIRSQIPHEPPNGFELAFEDLYRLAYRVAFRMLGDRGDAEDVAQEALARAALRWSRLEDRPEGWVTRVASNLAIDRIRHRGRTSSVINRPLGLVDPHIGERQDLVNGLRRLPRRQREAVVLRYLADFSEADVAIVMKCSEGTVKSHCARGLTALRRHLTELGEGGDGGVRAS